MDDRATRILMEQIIDARMASVLESQRATTAVLERFEHVLVGDKKYETVGLVQNVKDHTEVIDGWNDKLLEISGGMKAATWAGGIIFTLLTILHIGFECWLYIHGNAK